MCFAERAPATPAPASCSGRWGAWHERWDGRGYPDGLAGEKIPLESRIIFVCDSYHAMTTDRPYRKRLSHPEAVRRLRDASGTQLDPRVVEACLVVIARLRAAS